MMYCKSLLSIALVFLCVGTEVFAQSYYKNKSYQWKGNEMIQGKEIIAMFPKPFKSNRSRIVNGVIKYYLGNFASNYII